MISLVIDTIDETRALLGEYEQFLLGKAEGTREIYLRTVRHLVGWLAQQADNEKYFQPSQLTQAAVELYLTHLDQEGLSLHHRARVKSTISNFAQFLIEEKGLLQRNPTRSIDLPPVPLTRSSTALARAALDPAYAGGARWGSTWGSPLRIGLLGGMPGERRLLATDS